MQMLLSGVILSGIAGYVLTWNHGLRVAANVTRMCVILLTMLLALTGLGSHPAPTYAGAMVLGLTISVFGDLFFVLPRERFVPGLVAYLLGHLCYIYGMVTASGGFTLNWLPLVIIPLTLYLFRQVAGGMRSKGQQALVVPAAVYSVVLGTVLWQAVSGLLAPEGLPYRAVLVAAAGALYYFADAVMVWHRFVRPVKHQPLLEFGAYFGAQFLFAASVVWAP